MAKKLDLGKPEKFSLSHFFIRIFWFEPWFKVWYKNITVVGKENIEKNTPTIFAINHQNTAMDPLALVGTLPKQITWLARADLYNIKYVIPLLHTLKILPIFRKRDGLKNLENNEAVFEKIVDVLEKKKTVGIFPEGTHWGFRRLRQTKKAIPRIVELAEKRNNYDLDININPVGIYYDDYRKVRSNLFVKIGESIPMRQYVEGLKTNLQATENEIKDTIEAGLRTCMLDIPQMDETYHTVESLREICRGATSKKFAFKGNKQERQFLADKKTIEIIEEKEETGLFLHEIKKDVDEFERIRQRHGFPYELITNNGIDAFRLIWNCMKIIVGLPIFLCSAIVWVLDYIGMKQLAKLVKDPLFKNSVMFVGGRVIAMLTNTILVVLWLVFVPLPWWTALIFWASILLLWPVFIDYPRLVRQTLLGFKFNIGLVSRDNEIASICELRDKIIKDFTQIIQ